MNQDRRRRLEKTGEEEGRLEEKKEGQQRRRRKTGTGEEGRPAKEKKENRHWRRRKASKGEEGKPALEKRENRQWRRRLEEKEDRATEAGHRLRIERQPSKTGTLKQDFSRCVALKISRFIG
jgi:hypothetical protein